MSWGTVRDILKTRQVVTMVPPGAEGRVLNGYIFLVLTGLGSLKDVGATRLIDAKSRNGTTACEETAYQRAIVCVPVLVQPWAEPEIDHQVLWRSHRGHQELHGD